MPGDPPLERGSAPDDEDEDTRDEVYAGVWERLTGKTGEMVGQAHQRREEFERLYEELMQAEPADARALTDTESSRNIAKGVF